MYVCGWVFGCLLVQSVCVCVCVCFCACVCVSERVYVWVSSCKVYVYVRGCVFGCLAVHERCMSSRIRAHRAEDTAASYAATEQVEDAKSSIINMFDVCKRRYKQSC